MRFYVIYDFDCKRGMTKSFQPPKLHQWTLTEETNTWEDSEFNYLTDEGVEETYPIHRKYVAELNKEDFLQFIDEQGLFADDIETLGSLTELGHLPAISFRSERFYYGECIWHSAYITPFPECKRTKCKPNDWERIRTAVLNQCGL